MSKRSPPPLPPDAEQPSPEPQKEGFTLFALAGSRKLVDEPDVAASSLSPYVQRRIKSIVERIQVGDTAEGEAAVHDLLEIVEDRLDDTIQGRVNTPPAQSMRQRLAELDGRQGIYLAASGTLIQFNAILAAVHGAALTTVEVGALKAVMIAALVSHILAAFFLCWAARPVDGAPTQTAAMALMESHTLTDDTFRYYRRGWRMTLVALAVSTVVAVLFVLHTSGVVLSMGNAT
jgi:hypothetical protein